MEIKQIWNEKRPFSADLEPQQAIQILDDLEKLIKENKKWIEGLNEAKILLK